jgi:sodium-dependent dicarboxylate transporter 2/3/5
MSETVKPGGTYRTLDEQREVLSPAEERFEKARQTIGLFLGPVAFLVVYLLPTGLPPAQQTLAAILAFTIVYWLSEGHPHPGDGDSRAGALRGLRVGVERRRVRVVRVPTPSSSSSARSSSPRP